MFDVMHHSLKSTHVTLKCLIAVEAKFNIYIGTLHKLKQNSIHNIDVIVGNFVMLINWLFFFVFFYIILFMEFIMCLFHLSDCPSSSLIHVLHAFNEKLWKFLRLILINCVDQHFANPPSTCKFSYCFTVISQVNIPHL